MLEGLEAQISDAEAHLERLLTDTEYAVLTSTPAGHGPRRHLPVKASAAHPGHDHCVAGVRLFDGPLIAWGEIDRAEIREQVIRNRSYPHLSIVLVDPDAYRSRASGVTRTFVGLNKVLGFGPANVSAQQLPVPMPVVLEQMRRYHPGLWVGPRWPATPADQGIRPPTR